MYFKQLIAKYVTGNIPPNEMPELAYLGMKEGYYSPSLHILAGLEDIEDSYETDKYFKLALNELGLAIPDNRQAALQYAIVLGEQIVNDKTDVYHGVKQIVNMALAKYNFFDESKQYLYDTILFNEVYSLYDTYDELLVAEVEWVKGRSNEELMIKVNEDLFDAFIVWKEKIKSQIT
jgi:hypothetical protein